MGGTTMIMKAVVCIAIVLMGVCCIAEGAFGFGKSDRVRLEDISVLTLHHGKMTTGRRSSPVQQLKCVGGSAAHAFTPQVVQCYNRGSDGYDVQWECKTDMDNAYRFGQIEVICEGYSSPDDDYILKGSCGLEYTLEYTKEGMQQKNSGGHYHSYYDNDGSYDNYYNHSRQKSGKTDWIFLAIVGVLMYVIYRTCVANPPTESGTTGTDDGYPGPRGTGFGPGGGGGAPPPPGFRDDGYSGASCGGSQGYSSGYTRGAGTGGGGGLGGGGFWTGAAAGGLLGYLFGGNRNRGYGYGGYGGYGRPRYGYTAPRHNSGFSSGWGSSSSSGSGFGGFGGGSSGTRTASGFGGTRRR